MPCGLKNIGNTCYFNSILQVYYNIPSFATAIFTHADDDVPLKPLKKQAGEAEPQSEQTDVELDQLI